MSAGIAVVATEVGGIPELITQEYNGLLVRPNDPVHMAAAISNLINDPKEALDLGRNAQKTAAEKFSLRQMLEQHEKFYSDLVLCKT